MSVDHSYITKSRDLCSNLNDVVLFLNSMPDQASNELKIETLSLLTTLVEELSVSILLLAHDSRSAEERSLSA